jgi:subtilisin family serine protease
MEASSTINSDAGQADQRGDCASLIVFLGMMLWIWIIAGARTFTVLTLSAAPGPNTDRAIIPLAVGEAVLIGLPLLLLSAAWRRPRYRAIYQTWAVATGFLIFLLPAQAVNSTTIQLQAALQILMALLFSGATVVLARMRRNSNQHTMEEISTENPTIQGSTWRLLLPVLIFAGLIAYPWLAWGAFGSPLDVILELLAALSFGLAAALLIDRFMLVAFRARSLETWQDFVLGAFSIATTLLIIASGTGFNFGGMQLLLMLVLIVLGGVLMGLYRLGSNTRILALMIGMAAAAPMTLIDPTELALIISASPGETLQWALQAAGVSMAIGLALSLLFFLFLSRRKPSRDIEHAGANQPARLNSFLRLAALAVWAVAGGIYFLYGQPGFYGERLFVILKDQADLSSASGMKDYNARREFVYSTLVKQANSSQANLRQTLDRFRIGYTPYYLENSIEINADPVLRLWLNTRPEIERVLDSPRLRPLPRKPPQARGSAAAPNGPTWNLTLIGADRVWNELNVRGEGIVIGQSDSGVQGDHPELASSYRGKDGQNNYNWLDPWYHSKSPQDLMGHGTHTLGIVLGKTTGVAPDATWFACVNLARNLGDPPFYLNCMQFMLAPYPQDGDPFKDGDPSKGAHVSNNSWGCPPMEGCDPDALLYATNAMRAAGIFVEASAGNDGPACDTVTDPLSLYASAYTTGAIDRLGQLASFSSLGPVTVDGSGRIKPDIVAPGVEVLSAFPQNTYAIRSGTSMSGPHVVGVVALMWSANPALIGDIEQTEQILDQSASPYTGTLPSCSQANSDPSSAVGYGVLDAYTAVKMAQQVGK